MTHALATTDPQKLETAAQTLSTQIREGAAMIERAAVKMGEWLYHFEQIEGWEHDGSEAQTFKEWCGQPEAPSYSYSRQLIQIYRTYCVDFDVPVESLLGASVQRLLTGRKALEAGKAEPADVVADAESLSDSDMKARYGDGKTAPTDDALRRCERCGTLVPEGRLNGQG